MATTTFNTKIQLRYDTFANWNTANPTLLSGEVAIVNVPVDTGSVANEPAVLMKVGPGAFNDLPWVSALAADVIAACKSEATLKTFVNGVIADAGIASDDAVSALAARVTSVEGLVGDTAVATQISNAIDALNLATTYEAKGAAASALTEAKAYTDTEVAKVATTANANASAIETLKGDATVEGSIAADIAAAKEELAADIDAVDAKADKNASDITAATTKITALETAVGEGGSVGTQIDDKIAALDKADTAVAGQVVSAVSETDGIITVTRRALVEADIPTIGQDKVSGLAASLEAKQDVVAFNGAYDATTNKAATMADVNSAVAGLSGAMHFKGAVDALPTDVSAYAAGDVIIVGNKEYVFDGTAFKELGDESIYAVKGDIKDADVAADAAIAQSKIAGLTDALAAKASATDVATLSTKVTTLETSAGDTADDVAALTTRVTSAETAATALTTRVAAIEDDYLTSDDKTALETSIAAKASQTDLTAAVSRISANETAIAANTTAIASKANASDLSAIATSGNVADLEQTAGDTLVLSCGGANG